MNLFEYAEQQPHPRRDIREEMMDCYQYGSTDRYPKSPGYKARDTAKLAAQSVSSRAPRLRQLCVDQLLLYGALTADEAAANMGVDRLSIRPRFSELAALGKIADSGERRKNESGKSAVVWKLVR